jgi:photosystem I subunit 3
MKKYDADSAPTVALKSTMERTEKRFDFYAKSGLLCGTDGLPHLIADPGFAIKNGHSADVLIPTFGFLYFAWAGRKYVQTVAKTSNPQEKEIIIDVPVALKIMLSGYLWPVASWQEFVSGDFVAATDDITVSPR